MSKVFKTVAMVAGFVALAATGVGLAIGSAAVLAGIGTVSAIASAASAISLVAGTAAGLLQKKPKAVPSDASSRLTASLVTNEPRKIVFGHTAMATDVRYQAHTGGQEYLDWIVATASHTVAGHDELWFDNELAWSATTGVAAKYQGYLTVTVRNPGSPSNGIAIDGVWTNACTLTGCAYLHLRFRISGKDKKAESPFAQSVPTRITIRGRGAMVPDLRFPGVSASNQATWVYSSATGSGRNPALQLLFYLLGWRIEGKLAVGRGLPPARLDLDSFITAANFCDEPVALAAGGSEPRYRTDGVISEADDVSVVISNLLAAMNGVLRDNGGRISIVILHDDLDTPFELTDDDVLGDESWSQTPGIESAFNVVRGKFTDPSNAGLYQLLEYPEVRIPSPDGIERVDPFDLALVQSGSQCQRLAKGRLQRSLYPGVYKANFGARAWQLSLGRVVSLTHRGLGWNKKLFRITAQGIRTDGVVPMALREEHKDIYLWQNDERPSVQPAAPTAYDPVQAPVIRALYSGDVTYGDGTPIEQLKPAEPGARDPSKPTTPIGPGGRTVADILNDIDLNALTVAAEILRNGSWRVERDQILFPAPGVTLRQVVDQLGIVVDGNSAFITELKEVDSAGRAKSVLSLVSIAGGKKAIAGMELLAGGGIGEIYFVADLFGFVDPNGGNPIFPLRYGLDNRWYFDDVYIRLLDVDAVTTETIELFAIRKPYFAKMLSNQPLPATNGQRVRYLSATVTKDLAASDIRVQFNMRPRPGDKYAGTFIVGRTNPNGSVEEMDFQELWGPGVEIDGLTSFRMPQSYFNVFSGIAAGTYTFWLDFEKDRGPNISGAFMEAGSVFEVIEVKRA